MYYSIMFFFSDSWDNLVEAIGSIIAPAVMFEDVVAILLSKEMKGK
jgi:hypothetical protein